MINSNISSIENYINSNEEQLKWIAQDRDKDKDMIINAQKIVKQFIIDRKLVIFGGLAIDYALRLKGSSIYYDQDLPDYDCVSYKNVDDAYDLGEILATAGFENVKVIRAKHVETMRVRVNLITVADIGYIPKKYFDQYKYLKYDQLHILHPDIQRLDLHRAFCFPLNNAPMEDIFHRWEKDLYRFNLYEKYYPLKETIIKTASKEYIYDLPPINYAFNGFAAYALYRRELLKHVDIDDILKVDMEFISKKKMRVVQPVNDSYLYLVTNEIDLPGKKYHPILGIIPKSVRSDNVCIYYTNMLSITKIDNITVVNIQYLLMWLLFNYNFNDIIDDRPIYGLYYIHTLRMISIANTTLIKRKNPFNPSLVFLGEETQYEPILNQNPNLPVNYTPSKIGTRQVFDYSNFPMSGEEITN